MKDLDLVYLIKSQEYYKIGYTQNLQKRLKQFKTGNPDVEVIHIWVNLPIPARYWEKQLHRMLWEFRLKDRKEWFQFSDEVVKKIVKMSPVV